MFDPNKDKPNDLKKDQFLQIANTLKLSAKVTKNKK